MNLYSFFYAGTLGGAIGLALLSPGCGSKSDSDAASATYSSLKTNVFAVHCSGCHSFTQYSSIRTVVSAGNASASPLYTRVNSGSMPPSGGKLSDSQIQAIQTWINDGALDN